MNLTWKDGVTTILAVIVAALVYIETQPALGWTINPRLGVIILGLIGIGMCATGAREMENGSTWSTSLSALGGAAILLMIAGIIAAELWAFYAMAAIILTMWFVTTVRHMRVAA